MNSSRSDLLSGYAILQIDSTAALFYFTINFLTKTGFRAADGYTEYGLNPLYRIY